MGYLKGKTDMYLFYSNNCSPNIVGYDDAVYLSDPHKVRKTGYVFIYGGGGCHILVIYKQPIVATSFNNADIIVIMHEQVENVYG